MVLVTTALEETFPKDKNEKILFLGEWCKLYAKKDIYEQYDYETLPYHWDDRKKLYEDTKYIDSVFEEYLELLKNNLNKIHSVDFSLSYWRIVLGPWLRYFIEIVYDRYLSIKEVASKDINYVNIVNFNDADMIPNDMKEFNKFYVGDLWNQFIYQDIISYFDIVTKNINVKIDNKITVNRLSVKDKVKNILFYLNKFNKIHFFSSYINLRSLIPLQLLLKQVPTFGITANIKLKVSYSRSIRGKLKFFNTDNLFETILINLLKKQIPKYYLEGYKAYRKEVLQIYPKKAKIIFTANAFSDDDAFKFWAAEKKENETKYIITQHGGHHGMGLFSSHEKHQIKSSDKFFSWGWKLHNSNKVISVSTSKLDIKITPNPNGDILIPLSSFPRYSCHIMAMPIAGQTLGIIEDQVNYLRLVSNDLKKLLKFRIYQHDYGWDIKKRFMDKGYLDSMDNEESLNKSFHTRLSECRLCIATYNATTYLETFSANYPTLLYWNPSHWELNDDAKPYFDMLHEVGILHYTEQSLVKKLNEIYENPLLWWNMLIIQNAKDKFCLQFANRDNNLISNIKHLRGLKR